MRRQKHTLKGNQKGIISVDGISYRYEMRDKNSGKVIVLLDRTNEVSTMTRLLVILAGIFALSLVVLFYCRCCCQNGQ